METVIYLYDAKGNDREIGLDEVNPKKLGEHQLLWIDVSRSDETIIREVAEALGLKNVPIKSILNEEERPKIEIFENFFRFFIVSVEIDLQEKFKKNPIDCLAGKNFVVTIHKDKVKYFQEFQVREKGETTIGELDAENFVATLLDLHIVSYFRALETVEKQVDQLDEKVLKKDLKTENFLEEMVRLRQNVSCLRRWFLPHRDLFYSFSRPDFKQISDSDSAESFRLLGEHFENAFDAIESSRDTVLSLFELYATKSAQTTNDLVQRLTFITLIIGLLGVIAGTFGMNFEADTVFKTDYGFWITLVSMILISVGLTMYAKFKQWL